MKIKKVLLTGVIILTTLVFLAPLALLVLWSFVNRWPWPDLIPAYFSLRGWRFFLAPHSNSIKVLLFSIWLSLVVTFITLGISIPAGKALGLYKFRGKKFFQMMVLAPIIVPPLTVAMGIHVFFIRLGLANTFIGVVLVHLVPCLPYGVRILTNVFEALGESLEMQARVLGASRGSIFFYITLPRMIPGLLTAGSLVFIVSFSQYFLTFLIGGGRVITFPILMFPYIQSGDRLMASVYSLVFVGAAFILLSIVERMVKTFYSSESYFYL
jgi:putative spermidine/putrescine transport system permease protein